MQVEQQIPSPDMIPLTEIDGESGSNWIKMMTKKNYINSIDYTEFGNIDHLAIGDSSVIQKAVWITKEKEVVLKKVLPDELIIEQVEHEELVKEIKAFNSINDNLNDVDRKYIVEFFGISSREEFFLVLEYADKGDLETYLIQTPLKWEQKVNITRQVTCGLRFLHTNQILHRDLHTGNVVIKSDNSNLGIRAIIIDFGLSRVVSRNSRSNQHVKGRIIFMDPIILNRLCITFGEIYTYSSDIYSLGVIMWEISSNGQRMPEDDAKIFANLNRKHVKPVAGSTLSFVELYEKCWDENPGNRPDINCVYELIHKDDIISGEKVPAES
ncbi:10815_t:CDS:2, partial [Racocetra persica]